MEKDDIITGVLDENDRELDTAQIKKDFHDKRLMKHKQELIFNRVAFFSLFHLSAPYGLYLALTAAQWKTNSFGKYKLKQ